MRATDSPGSSAWIWFWALCGTLLPVVCLWYYAPKIEADLTTRVGAALTGVGVDPDRVFLRVDGRDVIFSGEVGEEMDPGKFVDTAAGIWGVRRVINQVEVFERVPSHLKMSLREGSVSLEGVLPDLQSVERVVQAVGGIFGQANIADQLTIDPRAREPQWTNELPDFIAALAVEDAFDVEIGEGGILMTGEVASEGRRLELAARAQGLAQELAVDNQLRVAPSEQARIQEERKQAQESIQALDLPEIKFKSQSFDLTEAGTRVLDVVSGVLTRYPKVRVEIGGHTDSQGEESVNLRLSKQRASSVHRYLISRGIDPDRLEVQGYGESIALAENDTPEGRARNRRIEFKVIQ